jgi:hypothetical protein
MIRKALIFSILAVFSFSYTFAQRSDEILSLRYTYFASSEVKDIFPSPIYPSGTFRGVETGLSSIGLNASFPIKIGDKTIIKPLVEYLGTQITYDKVPTLVAAEAQPKNLNSINVGLEIRQGFGQGWQIKLQGKPGLASNLEGERSKNDWIFQGFGIIGKSFNDNEDFFIGLGGSYNTILGKEQFLPVLDFYWQTGKLKMDLFLPYQGGIYFMPSDKFAIGVQGYIQGNSYNLAQQSAVIYQNFNRFEHNIIFGGLALNYQIVKNLQFKLEGGINANRTKEVKNEANKTVADYDPDKFSPFFGSVGISWGIKK